VVYFLSGKGGAIFRPLREKEVPLTPAEKSNTERSIQHFLSVQKRGETIGLKRSVSPSSERGGPLPLVRRKGGEDCKMSILYEEEISISLISKGGGKRACCHHIFGL